MDFTKVVRPGKVPVQLRIGFGGLFDDLPRTTTTRVDVFCKIEYERRRLSISGVIGPKANGDAHGGCGQINMEFAHRNAADNDDRYSSLYTVDNIVFAAGWDAGTWLDFLDVWARWHMNDMRSECEHQRALGWREKAREKVTIYHWRLSPEVRKTVREAEKSAAAALRRGETVAHSPEVLALVSLPTLVTTPSQEPPAEQYTANVPQFEGDHWNRASEEKRLGWLKPDEHPDGLLTRPCPECGYGYGSAWLHEAVPDDVLAFLRSLPDTDRTPAWV